MTNQEEINKPNLTFGLNKEKILSLNQRIDKFSGEEVSSLYEGRFTLLAFLIKEQSEAKNEGLELHTAINKILSKPDLKLNIQVLNEDSLYCLNAFQASIATEQLDKYMMNWVL